MSEFMRDIFIILLIGAIIGVLITRKLNRKSRKRYGTYDRPYDRKRESIEYRAGMSSAPVVQPPAVPENDILWKEIKVVQRKFAFDSKLEQDMYNFLRKEFGATVRIDFHVHLNEIFRIEKEDNYFNKLWVCHVDFLIRNRKNPAIVYFGIELDKHESHQFAENVKENDEFKTRVFEENGIPLLRLGGVSYPDFIPFRPDTYPEVLILCIKRTKDAVKSSQHNDGLYDVEEKS